MALAVPLVHAIQVSGEERSFVAAGAGPDFHDCVALIVGISRQQQLVQLFLERRNFSGEARQIGLGQADQLGI